MNLHPLALSINQIVGGGSGGFTPASLFVNGEQGLWYDLNDDSTIFQDSAGTTLATWGDPVGRVNDKSGNGNHAIQSTSGARMIRGRMPKRGRVNLVNSSENVSSTAFGNTNVLRVTRSGTDTIIETTSNTDHALEGSDTNYVSGLAYTKTVTMVKGSLATAPNIMQISFPSGAFGVAQYANVNVLTGAVEFVTGATCTSAADPNVVGGWRFTYTATATATTTTRSLLILFCNNNPAATRSPAYTGSITSDCKVYRMQTEQNSVATGYQHVIDSLGFNITESGQPSCGYLSYNGSNQWMQTAAAVNFTATDEMSVFAGVRKVSDAAAGIVAELSVSWSANTGSFVLAAPTGSGSLYIGAASRGNATFSISQLVSATDVAFAAPVFAVCSGLNDISGDLTDIRVNGASRGTATADKGTGNFGNYVTYFGARAGTSLFFNGLMFSVLIRGALTSGALLTNTERYVAERTPTINTFPTVSVAPVISGTPESGQTLTSTTGTWSGLGTITYAYQWKRDTDNVGTNANTYLLTDDDVGSNITCVVTASNTYGAASSTSNSLGPVSLPTWLIATGGDYGNPPTSGITTLTPFRIHEQEGDTLTRLTDPTSQANSGAWRSIAFSGDTNYVVGAKSSPTSGEPLMMVYSRSGLSFTELADPSTLPAGANAFACDASSDGTYFTVGSSGSPYIQNYKRNGSTLTKLTDPASLPAGQIIAAAFSHGDTYLACAGAATIFKIYKRSGDTFTDLSEPSAPTAAQTYGLAFSSDDTYLYRAVGGGVISIEIYKRSGDAFATLAAPTDMSSETASAIAASPDGNFVALGLGASDRLWVYERSGDTFTKLPNLAYRPSNGANISGISFSPDSKYMAVSLTISPYIVMYSIEGSTFTRITPSGLPTTAQYSVAFSGTI